MAKKKATRRPKPRKDSSLETPPGNPPQAASAVPAPAQSSAHSPSSMWGLAFWTPVWVGFSVAISVALSLVLGKFDRQTAVFSMLAATLFPIAAAVCSARFPALGSPGPWGWASICAFCLVCARTFSWGIQEIGGSIKVLLPNNLGDSSLHLALVNFLASSPGFWPVSPWFAPSPLEYPVGTDMFDAMMVLVFSRPPMESIAMTALLLSPLIAVLVWGWGRAFAVSLLLFCAPLSGLLSLAGKLPEETVWKSLFLSVIAPQRGMLVAVPLGVAFLIMARAACSPQPGQVSANSGKSWSDLVLLFLPLLPLPLFSFHATLALLPVAAWTALLLGRRSLWSLSAVLALSVAPVGWLLGAFSRGGYVRLESFACDPWKMLSTDCLIKNFGLLLPLLVWLLASQFRPSKIREARSSGRAWEWCASVYFPALFIFCLFVATSPWSWDNTKLMTWAVLGSAPFLWSETIARFPAWFRTFALVLLFLPGAGSLYEALGPSRHGHEIASAPEVREAIFARRLISPDSVLAASPEYNHPWFIAGRAFFLGYEGWVWSHGLDYKGKRSTLVSILSGAPGWDKKATEAGITHIVWSPREQRMTGKNSHPAASRWQEVFRGTSVSVFKNPKARPRQSRRAAAGS